MLDVILDVYRMMVFTPFPDRSLAWLDCVIEKCETCPMSEDEAANMVMGAALYELKRIRVFVLDAREFPELADLLPVSQLAPTPLAAGEQFSLTGYKRRVAARCCDLYDAMAVADQRLHHHRH